MENVNPLFMQQWLTGYTWTRIYFTQVGHSTTLMLLTWNEKKKWNEMKTIEKYVRKTMQLAGKLTGRAL